MIIEKELRTNLLYLLSTFKSRKIIIETEDIELCKNYIEDIFDQLGHNPDIINTNFENNSKKQFIVLGINGVEITFIQK